MGMSQNCVVKNCDKQLLPNGFSYSGATVNPSFFPSYSIVFPTKRQRTSINAVFAPRGITTTCLTGFYFKLTEFNIFLR
jgi:hypothetical protein